MNDRKEDISLLPEWDLLQVFSIKTVLRSAHIYYLTFCLCSSQILCILSVLSNFGLYNPERFSTFRIT